MYKLSVGCLFKNESHCMKEWLDHYLNRGVEHFYMINDQSTDDFMTILKDYDCITLFNADQSYYLGRQKNMYNQYILPHIKETKWLLMVDMDEFVWSPQYYLTHVLDQCEHLAQIQFYDVLYGSNHHIEQPLSLVDAFTMRQHEPRRCLKYFVHSQYEFTSLNVHHADFLMPELNKFIILDFNYFINNHYCCQSLDFWNNIKCTRGDSDHYLTRTMDMFHTLDINEVEDLGLKNQSVKIIGYFHICQKGDWRRSFDMIMNALKKSLYDYSVEIRCSVLSDDFIHDERFDDPKIKIIYKGKPEEYERPTLLHMREQAFIDPPNTRYYYLHTKGISHFNTPKEANVMDWINLLLYWNIEKWQTAINTLTTYNTYGCNFTGVHYSGNFWWSKPSHIKTLQSYIPAYYTAPEDWVTNIEWVGYGEYVKLTPKIFNVFSSGLQGMGHYEHRYPSLNYK